VCEHEIRPIFDLYGRWVVSSGLLESIQEQTKIRSQRGIYSVAVVLWLMIWQRLQPRGTLGHAVRQLVQGNGDSLLCDCKRVRERRISTAPGGYCQGIQRMPKLIPQLVTQDVVARLGRELGEAWPGLKGPVYVADGTTLLLPYTRKLARAYPPGNNQHGSGHWPIIRMVVLHDVSNGLAMYPKWGPLNGAKAVSEQGLVVSALDQIPGGATVIGDRNFGVFSVAWEVRKRKLGLIVRLTEARARKIFGSAISQEGDYPVRWRASRFDKPQGEPWDPEAVLEGRLIAIRFGRGKSKKWAYLFTTLSVSKEDVVSISSQRWNIETDLRSLKRTVQLQQLRSRSVDGIEKELLTAICAYNFVRALMCMAARRSGVPVRRLSFTQSLDVINDSWPRLASVSTKEEHAVIFEQILDWIARNELPTRAGPRSYPREVWGRGYRFPTRKTI
jgi:putative transposase